MNILKFTFRSLKYYKRINLWVILGTMVSTTIIVGALIIGDSIRYSLRQIVFNRLGNTEFAMSSGDRFFRSQVADELSEILQTPSAPLLQTKGIAIVDGGRQRVNNVQVVGVDSRFGEIGNTPDLYGNIDSDEAIINSQLASRLQLKTGDEFLLRIEKLDYFPKDVPMALDSDMSLAKRFTVKTVVSNREFGRFNLKADQVSPNTVYISLEFLGREMGLEDKSNVLLIAERKWNPVTVDEVNEVFKNVWSLSDAGFELDTVIENNYIELRSERIFIDTSVVSKARAVHANPQQIFTYFVNEISLNNRSTPYSFVSAISGLDLKDDEVLINDWLADDLNAKEGDLINLTYYLLEPSRSLIEADSDFRIKSIVPIQGVYSDRGLMPDFPGISDSENCRDWDPGIPINLDKIRNKDEDYWDDFQGTPKVFVSLNTAQRLWQNRFGNLTAIRFQQVEKETIGEDLTNTIDPVSLGFYFRDVRSEGLSASSQSVDFAQLFLGLSFFIIISALLLTSLLFVFNIEHRTEESGLFLALGYGRQTVKRIILIEGMIIVIAGSILGAICGILYNQIVLAALRTVWQEIVGTSSLQIHLKLSTIISGTLIGIIITMITIWLIVRNQLKQPIAGLQKGIAKLETIHRKKPTLSLIISIVCLIGVAFILILSDAGRGRDAFASFFIAGSLLLIGGIALANHLIVKKIYNIKPERLSLSDIGIRNNVRKRFRSLALIGLLASGLFIIFSVGANRQSSLKDAEKRESGTGGFALFGESVIPILYDLNSEKGRSFYALNELDPDAVKFVSLRVKEGDDASCLNLNRVSTPRLLGVNPDELLRRGSFTFVKTSAEIDPENPWEVLNQNFSADVIPGIADQTVIQWGLGKSVGDTLNYVSESGQVFKIKLVGGLANSIFQGNIVISDKALINKYPSISGSRLFIADAPVSEISEISQKINRALQDQGVELTPANEKLAQFSQVENTYLSIFMILGTFGLILGSIGIGIVIWRNVAERQGELALLRSVGFSRKAVQTLIVSEHIVLILAGIIFGIVTAFLAALPVLITPGSDIPYLTVILLLLIVVINAGIWVYAASFIAAKKDLIPALRNE
ncbi:MAG: FtsX-like permease family protein [bacterium]|nr:FtsX-like permease family protein [bacterium]